MSLLLLLLMRFLQYSSSSTQQVMVTISIMPLPVLVVLMIYIMLRYARRFLYPNSIFGTALPSLFFENNSLVRYITVQKVVEKNARKKVFGTTEKRYQMR